MNRKTILVLGLALVAVVLVTGCNKKQPVIPEPMEEVVPMETEPTVIENPVDVETTTDDAAFWMNGELGAINERATAEGLLGDVYFDYDKSNLSMEATDRLAENAAFMRAHPNYVFTVEGHCDERGTNGYNLALGDRRANGASSYLGSLGVSNSMSGVSYGEERPQCNDSGESCWSRNRRAHFVVTGK